MVCACGKSSPVVVITGPTAGGKSRLAVELARRLDGEVVNADSVQIYKDFDIGSWKPPFEELQIVPHHLFSCLSPEQQCDAGLFCKLAHETIFELASRSKLPLLTGGTGFYIRSLLCGLVDVREISIDAERAVSEKEKEVLESSGDLKSVMHQWLSSIDPNSAGEISPSDLQRTRRALLVKLSTGCSLCEMQKEHRHSGHNYRALVIAVLPERTKLYEVINKRVEQMLALGLVEEVRLLRRRYPLSCPAFGAIGYRHVSLFLDGQCSEQEMIELIKRDTRRFAKRQMTWWRNQPDRLGWRKMEVELSDTGKGASLVGISDNLEGVIRNFLEQNAQEEPSSVAFLPLERVDFR